MRNKVQVCASTGGRRLENERPSYMYVSMFEILDLVDFVQLCQLFLYIFNTFFLEKWKQALNGMALEQFMLVSADLLYKLHS